MSGRPISKQALEYKDKGNAEFKKGNHAAACEFYTYATEVDPNNPVHYTNRSFAYFMIGEEKKKKKDKEGSVTFYEKSLRDATKAVAKDAQWAKGHYRMCKAQVELGLFKEAVEAIQKAANIEPKNYEKQVPAIEKAMFAGMSTAEIAKMKGNKQFKEGKIEEAIKSYTTAIDTCTSAEIELKADCYGNRAACNRQLYLPDQTIADCTAALELKPDHVKALIRRAQAYESIEAYKKAYADFEMAARLSPGTKVAQDGTNRIRTAMRKLGMM